jgi:PAT family beta-lactamase induction signal transducer AmpG
MESQKKLPPVWMIGMTNATYGMFGGFAAICLPQTLAAQHLAMDKVVLITALVFTAYFWAFFLGPLLDVWFSRRTWALATAIASGAALTVALLFPGKLWLLIAASTAGVICSYLSSSALLGWLSTVVPGSESNRLSAWLNVWNIGAAGLFVILQAEATLRFPALLAAPLLGLALVAPTLIYPLLPAPGPDRLLAQESFAAFHRAILQLVRRREVVFGLALFAAPTGSFALSNIFGGVGDQYNASARWVGWVGGLGVVLAGSCGSLVVPWLAKGRPLRLVYLGIGVVGGLFTLSLTLLPHQPWVFAVALMGEGAFQAMAIACAFAIQFETLGENNPLAATGFAFMGAAVNLSIAYMVALDGWAAGIAGLRGSILTDGAISLAACLAMGLLLVVVGQGTGNSRQ